MAMHESQSLLLEMQVCRGREFLEFARPLIADAFPDGFAAAPSAFTSENLYRLYTRVKPDFLRLAAAPAAFTSENLSRLYTRVKPDFIRADADEVTYPCHIILRFEIEKPLIL